MLGFTQFPPQNLSHVDFHIETSETFSRDSFVLVRESEDLICAFHEVLI